MSAAVPAPGPRAICALGMHRAGTSMLARAVNLLGADLGPAGGLMPAAPDNPEGYWERAEICALHERVLGALRRTWDAAVPLPDGWEEAPALSPLRAELAVLVQRTFGGAPLFAWKDPRTCLLLPLWREALAGLGAELSIVSRCAARWTPPAPSSGATASRSRRASPSVRHTLAGLRALRGLPSVFVADDAFLDDGERELRRVAQALGIAWPADGAGLRAALGSFVGPALRHSASMPADLAAAGAPAPVSELAGPAGGSSRASASTSRPISRAWNALGATSAFGGASPPWSSTRSSRGGRRRRGVRVESARTQAALAGTGARLADTQLQLERERAVVAGMRASWSWRLTRRCGRCTASSPAAESAGRRGTPARAVRPAP